MIPSAAYRSQAQAARRRGALEEARELLNLAIAAAADEGDVVARAMNISLLAEVQGAAGDLEGAFELFADAVATFELAGDLTSAGVTYHQWAKLLFLNERLEHAGDYFIMSAECFAEAEDDTMLDAVTGSFGTYLEKCDNELADHMRRQWEAERLPTLPLA